MDTIMDFTAYTDEQLTQLIQNGNQDAMEYLMKKYAPLVKKSIRTLYLIGADAEDLSQEGMIGLFKAIQNYNISDSASFFTFASLCINRQIYSAIKASNRKKHSPLNSYISFYSRLNEEDTALIDNLEADSGSNPEHIVLDRENTAYLQDLIDTRLSKMEQQVLPLYLDGKSYADIGTILNKPVKSIDNAIQRIREKMRKLYPE